jgi:small ligand-binding sensory domain FIST
MYAAETKFASAAASGQDWREISRKVLEQLDLTEKTEFRPNIGFIYLTDKLAGDAASILTLFRSVTGIKHWTGCSALGICAFDGEFVGVPAISVLVGQVEEDEVRSFQLQAPNFKGMRQEIEPWLNTHDPLLVVLHADPKLETHPAQAIGEIESMVGGFMVGGLSSAQENDAIIGRDVMRSGVSGFVFTQKVAVATALSQGCVPVGPLHEVARGDQHIIAYLDGRLPLEVLDEDMNAYAEKKLGFRPDKETRNLGSEALRALKGDTHVAFPVQSSDLNDFTVRNIMAVDPESGMIAVAESLEDGQKIMFVHRNDESVRSDLSHTLVNLRKRIVQETGDFKPRAALYISCVARIEVSFRNDGKPGGEMELLREVLGDIPLAGFYAAGEISNNRLYGYTGILTLFL